MKCPVCGAENPQGSKSCQQCKTLLADNDHCPIILKIVAFLIPLVGWIMWVVWRKEFPKKAHVVVIYAWIGFAISFAINLLIALC